MWMEGVKIPLHYYYSSSALICMQKSLLTYLFLRGAFRGTNTNLCTLERTAEQSRVYFGGSYYC